MLRRSGITLAVWPLIGSLSVALAGDAAKKEAAPSGAAKTEAKNEAVAAPAPPPSETDRRLAQLKKLAGAWQTADDDKDGKPDTQVYYRVVSNGTAVAEFLMPGTDHEMISIFHKDGDGLMLTHYCALGNQPRMRAKAGGGEKEITFEFADGTNMKSRDEMHIDGLTLTFVDADNIVAAWKSYENGKFSEHSPTFKFARVKDPAQAGKIAALVAGPGAASATAEKK